MKKNEVILQMDVKTDFTIYTCDVIHDKKTGDQLLHFPNKMIEELDWRIGDTISFELTVDGVVLTNLDCQKRNKQAKLLRK